MIQGLKVTVSGIELKELCEKRAAHHTERASVYTAQAESMEKNQIEGMNYSGGDPKRALLEKKMGHEADASELTFIAKHIRLDEEYLLDNTDLHKLGICKARY